MSQQLVLHAHIVAHPQHLSRLEVIEEEVGLAGFQHGALGRPAPVEECLRRIEQRHFQGEASQRVHHCVCTLMLSAENILHAHLKLTAFALPVFLRHILQPSNNRHAVTSPIAVVHKTLACVLSRIVRQGGADYRTAQDGLVFANGDGAQALFHFAHLDVDTVVEHQGIGILLLRLADDVMHLAVIDDVLWREADEPVARGFVAPIGINNARRQVLCVADVGKGPCIRLGHIDHPCVDWDRLKDKREVHLAIGRDGIGFGQRYHRCPLHGKLLPVGPKCWFCSEGDGVSRLLLRHFEVEEHLRAVIVNRHFGDADDGHVDIARHYLIPHFCLCVSHHGYKSKQDGDNSLLVHIHFST